jgi:hypothetical protein
MTHQRKEQGLPPDRLTKTQEMVYELTVGEVMPPTMVTVSPEQTMAELRVLLRDNRLSGTPVVENGKLVGMISIEDLINALTDNAINAPIRERMKTKVECLYADELLVHCIAKFSKFGYRRTLHGEPSWSARRREYCRRPVEETSRIRKSESGVLTCQRPTAESL